MACLASVSFFCMHLGAPKPPMKTKTIKAILSNPATTATAPNLRAICSSNKDRFGVNHKYFGYLITHIDHFGEFCMNVNPCTRNITGYWVGPDIDDGWGYVQAFVNQMT